MLLPRLITSIVGIPIVMLSIYWGGIPFFVIMFGVIFLSLREYFVLATHGKYNTQPVIGTVVGIIIYLSIFLNGTAFGPLAENQGTAALLSLVLIAGFAGEMIRKQPQRAIERMSVTFFGSFLIPWTLGHLVLIRSLRPSGMLFVYYLFILIWAIDTGAYIVGKRIGRHRLAEMVSPKKTVEGAIGGTITGILVSMICHLTFLKEFVSLPESAVMGLLVSLVSQFSDLAESLLKRDVGVKDSANLLPGHGGMLDRFDSFLFTAPLLYYYLTIFK